MEFTSFIPQTNLSWGILGFLGFEKKNVCVWTCMYICVYCLSHESNYNKKYLRLITVYYVSYIQFLVHIRKKMEGCDVWFFSAFLSHHGYHGDSVNAVGFGANWASIYEAFLNHFLWCWLSSTVFIIPPFLLHVLIDIWLLNRAICMLIRLIGYYFAQRIIMCYYNYIFYCSIFYEHYISKIP